MAEQQDYTVLTPYASTIIWNYSDRLGTNKLTSGQEIDQLVLNTLSLKSISTQKSKSTASGTFEIRLAPTKNWVTVLAPGSWMAILMSRTPITKNDLRVKADPNKVKWFGRIDSVRVTVGVDQITGARQTEYIVTGTDWASIFNTTLYIDPGVSGLLQKQSSIGHAAQLAYHNQLNLLQGKLPSTSENIGALLKIWGDPGPVASQIIKDKGEYITKPAVNFTIPKEVSTYFGFKDKDDNTDLVNIIEPKTGILKKISSVDEYSDSYLDEREAVGVILPGDILGEHDFWSVMVGQSNHTLNEMLADLRWEDDKPTLALYKRIRPFITDKKSLTADKQKVGDGGGAIGSNVERISSSFENLRRIRIPLHEVVSFNAGTNWRDKINFVEVQLDRGADSQVKNPQIKIQAQFYDEEAFNREGLRPMIARTRQFPTSKKEQGGQLKPFDLQEVFSWKYLLKEWYFNTHRMLNGTAVFIGQDKYIQVGDNIIIDAKIIGPSYNINKTSTIKRDRSFLTAHVESVSHSFQVNPNGVREWLTTVQFVRGVITDTDGRLFANTDGMLEQDTTKTEVAQELNNANVVSTSAHKDPD